MREDSNLDVYYGAADRAIAAVCVRLPSDLQTQARMKTRRALIDLPELAASGASRPSPAIAAWVTTVGKKITIT